MQNEHTQLVRGLGLIAAISVNVANIIGTGVFLKARVITCNVGTPGKALMVWVFAGLLSLAGALTYAELLAMMPRAAGEYGSRWLSAHHGARGLRVRHAGRTFVLRRRVQRRQVDQDGVCVRAGVEGASRAEVLTDRGFFLMSKKSVYSVHPGVLMTQKWLAELKQKTGRTCDEWLKLIKKDGPVDEKARRDWLREKHGLNTMTSTWLAERSFGKGAEMEDPDLYLESAERDVDKMFSGGKAHLRPVYDALLKLGLKTGKEAKACPCQTIVPLYRNHVFAQIKPTTQTRIDMGFALGDMKPSGRLIDTGGFAKKDRITHRIPITSKEDIDDEVKHWLKVAYDRDA